MKVVYSEQVRKFLLNSEKTLKDKNGKYIVSKERCKEKIVKIRKFLQSLGTNIEEFKVCDMKKLGQEFDKQNQPLNNSLKQTSYKDESKYEWRISLLPLSKNIIMIYKILGSDAVNEKLKIIS